MDKIEKPVCTRCNDTGVIDFLESVPGESHLPSWGQKECECQSRDLPEEDNRVDE